MGDEKDKEKDKNEDEPWEIPPYDPKRGNHLRKLAEAEEKKAKKKVKEKDRKED